MSFRDTRDYKSCKCTKGLHLVWKIPLWKDEIDDSKGASESSREFWGSELNNITQTD